MKRSLMHAAILASFLFSASFARADDPGYFLSWQQKKQLMGLGRIQDSTGGRDHLQATTQADAVDMNSFGLALVCADLGAPLFS